eukprot:5579933-Pyramimonas_sp.AAC.1
MVAYSPAQCTTVVAYSPAQQWSHLRARLCESGPTGQLPRHPALKPLFPAEQLPRHPALETAPPALSRMPEAFAVHRLVESALAFDATTLGAHQTPGGDEAPPGGDKAPPGGGKAPPGDDKALG